MVWLVLDILLVAIIAFSIFAGYRQGLLGSVLRLAGFFVAIAAAAVLSDKLAPYIFNNYLYDGLMQTLTEQISRNPGAQQIISSINSGAIGILVGIGIISSESIAAKIASKAGMEPSYISEEIVNDVLADPVIAIVKTILFVVLFVIAFFIVKLLIRALMGVNKVPLLGAANRLLGSCFGLCQGLLIDILAVKLIAAVMSATADGITALQTVAVPKTIVFAFFYNMQLF